MKRFSDKRQIKQISSNPLKQNETQIHPLTLEILKNNENKNIVLTQFWLSNEDNDSNLLKVTFQNNKHLVKSRSDKDNMEIPNLSLPLDNVLHIYGINNYDELITKIEENKSNTKTIYRLINIFTRIEFDELKKFNNSLIKIFKLVFENKKLDDEFIKKFLKKWFQGKSKDDFFLNICIDFENFLG